MANLEELKKSSNEALSNSDYKKAEELLVKLLELEPESYTALNNLGMIYFVNNKQEESYKYFQKAYDLNPKLLEANQNLGSYYLYKGDIEKSEEYFLKALQIDANNFNTYHNLSTLYLQSEQFSKAKKSLEKLLQLDSDNFQASFMLGSIFLNLKEYYPAIANFLYTLNLNKELHNARMGLAESYYKIGRYKAALRELDILFVSVPNMVSPYIKSALILIEMGNNKDAIPYLQKALQIDQTNLDTMEMLAILYEENGNRDKAEDLYQQMIIIDPESKVALEALDRLEEVNKKLSQTT